VVLKNASEDEEKHYEIEWLVGDTQFFCILSDNAFFTSRGFGKLLTVYNLLYM